MSHCFRIESCPNFVHNIYCSAPLCIWSMTFPYLGINLKSTLQKICRIIIQPIICMTSHFNGWATVLLEKCWFLPGHTVRLYKVHQELCNKCWADKVTVSLGIWEKTYIIYMATHLLVPLFPFYMSCQWHTIIWQSLVCSMQ